MSYVCDVCGRVCVYRRNIAEAHYTSGQIYTVEMYVIEIPWDVASDGKTIMLCASKCWRAAQELVMTLDSPITEFIALAKTVAREMVKRVRAGGTP